MTRSYSAFVLILLLGSPAACNRPSKGDCEKAIANIRLLAGTESDDFGDPDAAIRSCQGNASKKTVNCVVNARTPADLEKCEGGLFDEMFKEEIEAVNKAKMDEAKPDEAKTPVPAKTPDQPKPDPAKQPAATPPSN